MIEFFQSLQGFQAVLWYIAIFSSIIFLVQSAMVLFGGDTDTDTDTDVDIDTDIDTDVDNAQEDTGKSFGWFSFKNLVNFFLLFSWVGLSCLNAGFSTWLTLLISTLSGVAFVFVMLLLFKAINKLSQDGTPKLSSIIGETGTVYLTIPEKDKGKGKVNIVLGDSVKTLDAISESNEIKTGTSIKVTKISNGILVVE